MSASSKEGRAPRCWWRNKWGSDETARAYAAYLLLLLPQPQVGNHASMCGMVGLWWIGTIAMHLLSFASLLPSGRFFFQTKSPNFRWTFILMWDVRLSWQKCKSKTHRGLGASSLGCLKGASSADCIRGHSAAGWRMFSPTHPLVSPQYSHPSPCRTVLGQNAN